MLAAPMARLQQGKQAAVTTGKAGTTGIPCAMVLTLIRALLGVPGLLATVVLRYVPQNLIPASGDRDHTISPSASARLVRRRQHVHRIPLPTSVTIAIRPSDGGGMAASMHIF